MYETHTYKIYILHLLNVIFITFNNTIKFSYLLNLIKTIINPIERKIFIYIFTSIQSNYFIIYSFKVLFC